MSNEVAKFAGGLPANPEDLEAGLQNLGASIQAGSGGMPFLRLLKSGYFAYGADSVEPEEGSEWAINPYSLQHGFACWGESELLGEVMVPFTAQPPAKADLPDYGFEWRQQVSMVLQCLTGEDTGQTVLYKGTSTGLLNAVKELIAQLVGQLQKDKVNIVPVVELETDSYVHKKWGETWYPVLTVKEWVSMDGIAEQAESDDDAPAETEAVAAPPAEPEPEVIPAERPRRRRAATGKTSKAAKAETQEAATAEPSNRRRRRRG